ncbi:MAG: ROK family protein [Hyphomicrobiales bacterium]|nr:ROK family protein [Hyphomicrobiales bacterium]
MITAFDIGGSLIKSASVAGIDEIVPIGDAPTPHHDFDAFVGVVRSMIDKNPLPCSGIALSITGVIDHDSGMIKCANIPCVNDTALEVELRQQLNLPVWVANDADCFVLAEALSGAGQGHNNVFGIILGSGVGGGVVIEGKLISGSGGYAGEWGHGSKVAWTSHSWPHPIAEFLCECGNSGCVNTVGGARGMERLHRYLHKENLTSREITGKWLVKDIRSSTTINVMIDLVSNQLAMILNVLGSSIVPVGGGLANVEEFVELLDVSVRAKMLNKPTEPLIIAGQCRIEPGLIGAAMLGLQKIGYYEITT